MFAHSTVIYKYERAYLPKWLTNSWPWWAVRVALTKICIDFLITAFALRSLRACIAVWASVHYLPLIFMCVVFFMGSIFPVLNPGQVAETGQCLKQRQQPLFQQQQEQQLQRGMHESDKKAQAAQSLGTAANDARKAHKGKHSSVVQAAQPLG